MIKHIAKSLNIKLENQFRDMCLMHYLCDSDHSHTIDQIFLRYFLVWYAIKKSKNDV